jgi:PAS domain S-box-containing protein
MGFIFFGQIVDILYLKINSMEGSLKNSPIEDNKDEKEMAREAIQSKFMLHAILENTVDLIWSVDREYRLLFFNTHFQRFMQNLTEKDIDLGDNIIEIVPEFYRDDLILLCNRALAGEQFTEERAKDNCSPETILEYFFNPIRNELNDVTGLSVFMRNISERKRSDKKLLESELRYRSLIEQASDSILTANQDGDYIDVNSSACKLLGYTREELLTRGAKDILSKDFIKLLPSRFDGLKAGKSFIQEIKLKRKDGTLVDVETNSRMLSDGRFVDIVRDITDRKNATHELAQSLKEVIDYKFALDESSIVAITNSSGIIKYVNDNFCKISKYTSAELIGQDHRLVNSKHHSKAFIAQLWSTISKGNVWRGDIKSKAKDGEIYWVDTTIVPFLNEEGNPYQYVAIQFDISERKGAEEELARGEKRFRALVEHNDGIIIMLDERLNSIYRSPSADRITGWTLADKETQSPFGQVHPDEQAELKNYLEEMKINPGKAIPIKFRIKHKEENFVWLEGTMTNLLHDVNVASIIVNMRDITEQKINEDRLKEDELRYRSLIEQATDAICISDADLKYIDINPSGCEMLGYTKKEFLNLSVKDLVLEDVKTNSLRIPKSKSKKTTLYERRLKRSNGTLLEVEASEKMLKDGRFIMFARDITKRKKSDKQVLKMNVQLRNLLIHLQNVREEERTIIAREIHDELGQQLTALKMDTSWIIKKIPSEDKLVHEKVLDMISLIDQTVTAVRRISSNLRPSILDDLGLLPALEWQCNEFSKRTGIESVCNFDIHNFQPEEKLSTNIFRVYQEALTNVARHSQATKVETILREKNGCVELLIRDNGKGFDLQEAKNKNSWGLVGMRERALIFQIELTIDSEKRKGTTVTLKIPNSHKAAKKV